MSLGLGVSIFFIFANAATHALANSAINSSVLRPWTGSHLPEFSLKDVGGKPLNLSDYRGQPVLVHFFATWCEPCRPEMQALERLAQRPDAEALRIISISVNEPASRVRRFLEKTPVGFPVLLDENRTASRTWSVDLLPTTYILDADLTPRFHVEHDVEWDRVDIPALLKILAARRGAPPTKPSPSTTIR